MLQLHFPHGDTEAFRQFVAKAAARVSGNPDATVLFHLFNNTAQRQVTDNAVAIVHDIMPKALVVGCSTFGNICDGRFVDAGNPCLSAACSVFEDPGTSVEVHQFPLDRSTWISTADALVNLVKDRPWVKAIEMLSTIIDVSMFEFCAAIDAVPKDIVFFGGAALCQETMDMFSGLPYVFSSPGEPDGHAVAFVLYDGDTFHARVQTVYGWRPLGMPMAVTKADGPVLYELDGKPAFDRYHHYLKIEDDESFADKSLYFPFMFDIGGATVIKAPVKVGDDHSLTLTSDLADIHRTCHISYGVPATILQSIDETAALLRSFAPQSIFAFSCAGRFTYWGAQEVSSETLPFGPIAPVIGFYTGGEFSRVDNKLMHHNMTLVIAAMREGDTAEEPEKDIPVLPHELTKQMSIVNSLAAFAGATSQELQEAYARMEAMAKTDSLTGIPNRREIDTLLTDVVVSAAREESPNDVMPCIIMLDLDSFKEINDTYGHNAGDDVLRRFATLLQQFADSAGGSCGRWGGEEFMVVLKQSSASEALALAQRIIDAFSAIDFPIAGQHTVSAGVAQALPDESPNTLCARADEALYTAKSAGKNRAVLA